MVEQYKVYKETDKSWVVLNKEKKHFGEFFDLDEARKYCKFMNNEDEKQTEKQRKHKEGYLWYAICFMIDEWEKTTGRGFMRDYENMLMGN